MLTLKSKIKSLSNDLFFFQTNYIVLIFKFQILIGELVASAFGYAVELVDLNNDGLDDLIVGAPQYYDR